MEKQPKIQKESTCLNKKRTRSKTKNKKNKVKDERYVILNTIIKKLYDYFNAYCMEFKQTHFPPESKQTESESKKEDIKPPLNVESKNVIEDKEEGKSEISNQVTSKHILKDALNYFLTYIKNPEGIELKQQFEEPLTEDSFYNMSFYYINANYLSGEVVNKIIQLMPIKDEPNSIKNYEIQLTLLEAIKTFFSYLKLIKFNLFEKKTVLYQSVYRDIILSCFIDFYQIPCELYEFVINKQPLTFINKKYLFNKYSEGEQVDWDTMISIATSPVAIEAYLEVAKQQCLFSLNPSVELNETELEEKKNQIKKEVIRILNEYKLFRGELNTTNQSTYGMSSVNKYILLNYRMKIENTVINENKIRANAAIVVTLLHEITHILIRTSKGNIDSYFYNTTEFSSIPSPHNKESGYCLEYLIFHKFDIVFPTEPSKYILTINNWNQSIKDFQTNFVKIYDEGIKSKSFFTVGRTKLINNTINNRKAFICNKGAAISFIENWKY